MSDRSKESARVRARRYYARNCEQCLAKDKRYREENAEAIRERRKERYQANIEEERRKARERMRGRPSKPLTSEQRARKNARARERYNPRARQQRPVVVRLAQPKPVVPVEIRNAYARSHPNSIIRKKYPTVEALRRAYGVAA